MKNVLILFIFLAMSTMVFGQKYLSQTGTISFFSEAPLENIEAVNHQVSSVINVENGDMVFSLLLKAFTFEKALMQEHFNEKYVESEKYPKSTFKGKIQDFDQGSLSDSPKEFLIKGTLSIHGKSKEVETKGTLLKKGDVISGKCKFTINLDDFDIKIPSAVKDNVSKTIDITIDIDYEKL